MRKFICMWLGGLLTLLWAATGWALIPPPSDLAAGDLAAGRAVFFNNGQPKVALLGTALTDFQNALTVDPTALPTAPTVQQAHFFLAITEGMSEIAKQGNGTGIKTLRDLVQSFGGNWTGVASLLAMQSGGMPFTPPNYSAATPPPDPLPSGADVQAFLTSFADALGAATNDLDQINSAFPPITVSTTESGLPQPVVIDYGDVLAIKSIIHTMRFFAYLSNAWDLNINPRRLILQGLAGTVELKRDLVDLYPTLLNLKTDGSTATTMTTAKNTLNAAVDSTAGAVTTIAAAQESLGVYLVGSRAENLFAFGSQADIDSANAHLAILSSIETSLKNDTTVDMPDASGKTFDFNYLFGDGASKLPLDIRSSLPVASLNTRNRIMPGIYSLSSGILGGILPNITSPDLFISTFGNHLIATVPEPPFLGLVRAGVDQATVYFSPSLHDGGSPITGYLVTASPGGIQATGGGSPITVTGLTPNTAYTFTVKAVNAVGDSLPSWPSGSVMAGSAVPGAPIIIMARPGNGQVTVAFIPPMMRGGSLITSYTVTANPGGLTASGPTSPLTVTGLINGTAYTFTVTATNTQGPGPASSPSRQVTPNATIPAAPTGVSANISGGQATVSFTPPSDGGSPITGYAVLVRPGGRMVNAGPGIPVTVSGLTTGVNYTFIVRARNAVGLSAPSTPSNMVQSLSTPGAPMIIMTRPGNGQVAVSFIPPRINGGSPVTSYTVTANPGGLTVSGLTRPLTVTGLTNGTAYTFTVTATNAQGTGPASTASRPVIPAATPDAPTGVSAVSGVGKATISFTPPVATGGKPILRYIVTALPSGKTMMGLASPLTMIGLAKGTPYTFTVRAMNMLGMGPASAASSPVTPQ